MQRRHIPAVGLRYWTALIAVSIFGANLGDFAAHDLHLGHAWGLLPEAALLAVVFFLERGDRSRNQWYYWGAIVIVRAAATNLGDLAAGDLKLGRPLAAVVLAIVLAGVVLATWLRSRVDVEPAFKDPSSLPNTDSGYWLAMLVAGTLGTVLGDYTSFGLGLGTRYASIVLGAVLLVSFGFGVWGLFARIGYHWFMIAVVRTAGTAMGDYVAGKEVGIGLPASTALTGLFFVLLVWLWKDDRDAAGHEEPNPVYAEQ